MNAQISIRTSILCTVCFLSGLGLLAIYASSSISAAQLYGDSLFYFKRQFTTFFLGLILLATVLFANGGVMGLIAGKARHD